MVVQQMFKYRIYPSSKQKIKLINNFKICKSAYNKLLAISIDAYKFGKVSLTKFDYDAINKGYSSDVHSQVIQNVSDRVRKAYQNFFRRVKSKEKKKGFPRFKSKINSITFPQSGFKILSDKRLRLSKIGSVPIILHRVPKGKIKTLTIKVNKARQWFAIFACEIEETKALHPSKNKIGIDVGLENFATFSNGETIDNPRFLIQSEKRLTGLQRRLSKKKKGSKNRNKARFRVAKQHLKVTNQRTDFLHKLSYRIAKSNSFIAVEDLKVTNMVKNRWLAKSISDASWNSFIQMLSYKAVRCGGQFVKVNPRNTSKTCSKCGTITEMTLNKRKFKCPSCGFVCHRDLNAAINILSVGQDLPEFTPVDDCVRPSAMKAVVNEAGTICDNC